MFLFSAMSCYLLRSGELHNRSMASAPPIRSFVEGRLPFVTLLSRVAKAVSDEERFGDVVVRSRQCLSLRRTCCGLGGSRVSAGGCALE